MCRTHHRSLILATLLGLAACTEQPAEPDDPRRTPELINIQRDWVISKVPLDGLADVVVAIDSSTGMGTVDTTVVIGEVSVFPDGEDHEAKAEVFSSETGSTYWVSAQAPSWSHSPENTMGSAADLAQFQAFRKQSADASLRYVITEVLLEAIDDNARSPLDDGCDWWSGVRPDECDKLIRATVSFDLEAIYWIADSDSAPTYFETAGSARLFGFRDIGWKPEALTHGDVTAHLWNETDFDVTFVAPAHPQWRLQAPITVDVPIDSLPIGTLIFVESTVKARAYSRRRDEAYAAAYFRDPLKTGGGSFAYEGLEPVAEQPPPDLRLDRSPRCTGDDPAGTLQFHSSAYFEPEQPGGRAWIVVTRAGGREGVAAARLTTNAGTAAAGSDYEHVEAYVQFGDGEAGSRLAVVPIVADTIAESNEVVDLTLSEVPGCGTVGTPSTATLTIEDDDRPPPVTPTYTVGGTVTGLVGTGLVLTNLSTDDLSVSADGPFVFDRDFADHIPYEVRVATQPENPAQVCTVSDGSGRINGADVTDVAVECVTPPPVGPLDTGFGDDGKVTEGTMRGASDMALQDDGKIVLVGRNTIARYNADGSLDAGFGTGGEVTVEFNNASDILNAVTIQTDGKIVAVGYADDPGGTGGDVLAIARYDADGTPDDTFGADGTITTAVSGSVDRAADVVVQADGSIVVAGQTLVPGVGGGNDFAVVRYTNAGELDPDFGSDGVVRTNIAGRTDLGQAVALQSDGKILVAGRVADTGGDSPDIAIVRYNPDGSLDADFASGGVAHYVTDDVWDEARDLVLQPDGKIVVVGSSRALGLDEHYRFLIGRFNADGSLDASFGGNGVILDTFSALDDFGFGVTLQSDGKIIAVGQAANLGNPNFAIERFNADGTLDPDFGNDGKLIVDFYGADDRAFAAATQPDGKLVVAGSAYNGTQTGVGLIRVLP